MKYLNDDESEVFPHRAEQQRIVQDLQEAKRTAWNEADAARQYYLNQI